jgi:hypothetical protein
MLGAIVQEWGRLEEKKRGFPHLSAFLFSDLLKLSCLHHSIQLHFPTASNSGCQMGEGEKKFKSTSNSLTLCALVVCADLLTDIYFSKFPNCCQEFSPGVLLAFHEMGRLASVYSIFLGTGSLEYLFTTTI